MFHLILLFPLAVSLASAAPNPHPLTVPDILDPSALKDGHDGKPAVDPCQNFYRFSCGAWVDETVIPADKASVMHQSTALLDQSDERLRDALLKLDHGDLKLKTESSPQLLDYYHSCMDFSKTQAKALSALKPYLSAIGQMKAKSDLALIAAKLHPTGTSAFLGFGSGQDLVKSTDVIGFIDQGPLGLPEPSYYSAQDAKSVDIRNKYVQHIAKILGLAGVKNSTAQAKAAFAIETDLASKAYSFDERQDPSKINHPISLAELEKQVPEFNWEDYFAGIGAPASKLNIDEPDYFSHLNEVLAKISLADLKTYLTWHLLHRAADTLGPKFAEEDFSFWHKFLRGEKQMKPRWKQCTQAIEHTLGYALAEVYVKTIDTVAIRAKIAAMIDWVKQSFTEDLDTMGWLDSKTKKAALEKLAALKQKIGAPEKWRDYSSLKTDRSSYFGNSVKAIAFEFHRDLAKIGKPLDRMEWDMMPWEFNAYYDPPKNEFVFPFGILQPPSFDVQASNGANLGSFGGGTIGHELTHGYDNFGRQYDGEGNLKDWWSEDTKKNFEERSQCFVKQASAYKIEEVGLNVDGKKTLPENLADQGGVKLGYAALLIAQAKQPKSISLWSGKYNENQQFWIAYAQSWCGKQTPETLRVQITTNEHPPEEFRVNGVVMNRPEFAHDFACKDGSPMAPVNRCSIW